MGRGSHAESKMLAVIVLKMRGVKIVNVNLLITQVN
jgi:hypothetical protein